MRAISALAVALALSATVFACAATTDEPTADTADGQDSSEQDITSARKQLGGDWKNKDGSLDAFAFNADGTFIHDQLRVLNGVLVNGHGGGNTFGRDTGRYTTSTKHGTVTLHVTDGWHAGSTEVYAFTYTAARILNGVFLPGHEPSASLDLTLQPLPTERLAHPNPTKHYGHVGSFCAAVGAACVGLAPTSCKGGTVLDATKFSCGGGLGVECCQK